MITDLVTMIQESHSIVFFGGAGVSTESGIPDFRPVPVFIVIRLIHIRQRR